MCPQLICINYGIFTIKWSHFLVSFTPRPNVTSFSFSSSLSRMCYSLFPTQQLVIVPIICHSTKTHWPSFSMSSLSLAQSFPVRKGSLSVNLFFVVYFPQSTSWIKGIWKSLWLNIGCCAPASSISSVNWWKVLPCCYCFYPAVTHMRAHTFWSSVIRMGLCVHPQFPLF